MMRYRSTTICALLFLLLAAGVQPSTAGDPAGVDASGRRPGESFRTATSRQGMSIEMSVTQADGTPGSDHVLEGEFANLAIRVRDANTLVPVTSLYPAVWIDQRKEIKGDRKQQELLSCSDKIRSYLKGGLSYRPDIDLNSYYILSLNNDATISVIDPIMGVAGFSQMYKMLLLPAPGADWVSSRDEKTLFVTIPRTGQVAQVDLEQFTVRSSTPAGSLPGRVVLQPDDRYLWIGNDAPGSAGGVTVLDADSGATVANIATAPGQHDIALSDDSLTAFVTNRDAGTVTIIDTQTLRPSGVLKTGSRPSAVAYSALSASAYVVDELDGTITVIDGRKREVSRVIRDVPGLVTIRFAPGNRWGLAVNRITNSVLVLDVSSNSIAYREPVGAEPEQVSFTSAFAYIRSRGTAEVSMLALDSIGKGDRVTILKVSGGSLAPSESSYVPSVADSIAATPEGNAVVIASPADATVIYYMEGMAVPMGSFKNSGRLPRALKTVNRSLRETEPGVYSARIKIPRSGSYDVMFLLDSPRITECFSFQADANPALRKMKTDRPVRLEFLNPERVVKSGHPVTVRVRVVDEASGEALAMPLELTALSSLAPYGTWQERHAAVWKGNGIYEFIFTPPEHGMYQVYFALPGLKVGFAQLPYLTLQAVLK